MAEAVINGKSKVELAMLGGIAVAMFWGGWYAKDVGRTADELKSQFNRIESRLDNFPTRFELESLVKSGISAETKSLHEQFGNLDARIQAIERAKEKP